MYIVHNLNGVSWFLVEDVVGSRSNSIISHADMIHIVKIVRVLTTLGGETRDGMIPTTIGAHKMKDATTKGNFFIASGPSNRKCHPKYSTFPSINCYWS